MHYRLHCLDSEGKVTTTLELGSQNDTSATAFAADLSRNHEMELWQGERLVTRREAGRKTG